MFPPVRCVVWRCWASACTWWWTSRWPHSPLPWPASTSPTCSWSAASSSPACPSWASWALWRRTAVSSWRYGTRRLGCCAVVLVCLLTSRVQKALCNFGVVCTPSPHPSLGLGPHRCHKMIKRDDRKKNVLHKIRFLFPDFSQISCLPPSCLTSVSDSHWFLLLIYFWAF